MQEAPCQQPEPGSPRALLDIDQDDDIHKPRPSRNAAVLRQDAPDQSSFTLERAKSRDALTILPRPETRFFTKDTPSHSRDSSTTTSVKPGRPKHMPVIINPRSLSLRSNMTTQERLSQGQRQSVRAETLSPKEPTEQSTTSSTFGNLFRKRIRERPVKTPTAPSTHWKPFEEPPDGPPSSSSWIRGGEGDEDDREQRTAFFKKKAEKDESARRTRRCSHSRTERLQPKPSGESLVDFKSAINNYPVPALPHAAAIRNKNPKGLTVETTTANRLRKPQSSSVLGMAFRRGARRASMSKIVMDEEE